MLLEVLQSVGISNSPARYLLRPDLFESQNVRVEVETHGEITRGMSIADWKGQWGKERNCTVLRRRLGETWIGCLHEAAVRESHGLTPVLSRITDRDEFYRVFVRAIARLPVS